MRLIISPKASKQYKKLPQKDKQKIKQKLILIESTPYAGKPLKGELTGYLSLKAWPFRIIYRVHKSKKQIWITSILHRQGVYK